MMNNEKTDQEICWNKKLDQNFQETSISWV